MSKLYPPIIFFNPSNTERISSTFYPFKFIRNAGILLFLNLFFLNNIFAQKAKSPATKVVSAKKLPNHFATRIENAKPSQFTKSKKSIEEKARSVEERDQFLFDMLKDPATGKIPRNASRLAVDAALISPKYEQLPVSQRPAGVMTVDVKGPTNLGGKTRALGIDVRNANIMIGGSTSSGVYRSSNGGASWTRVVPTGAIHNITSVAQDTRPGFQDTWYFGTGEASGNSASLGSSYRGFGIFKSTDNGITWNRLSSTSVGALEAFDNAFDYVHRIVVNPVNGDIYAASSNTIQKSSDGGSTFTPVLGTFTNLAIYTEIICTPTGRLYAAFAGTDANEGVYTSTTGNSGSWTKIAGTILGVVTPASWKAANGYGRVVLNYAPSNPDIVYALYDNKKVSSCTTPALEADFFVYDQSANTWTDRSANLPDEPGCLSGNDPFATQGGYDLAITVQPNNANNVFIGGTNIYNSTDGFATTTNTKRIGGYASPASYSQYPNSHPDIHYFLFEPGSNNIMYAADDGGIQKADITTPVITWTPLNNSYVTYMYYHVDMSPVMGQNVFLGGTQDNGTPVIDGGTTGTSVFGGDGTGVGFISYTNPTLFNIIASSQSGNLVRLTAPSFGFGIKPSGSVSIFVTYCNLDQDNTNNLYYAGLTSLYRTRNASGITSGALGSASTNWERMTGAGISGNIRSMATSRNKAFSDLPYSVSDANRKLYIGTETGLVYRLDDPAFTAAATAAVNITPAGAPAAIVSSVSMNPSNDKEVIITYSNYNVNSVYHTLDATATPVVWTVIEGPAGTPVQLASARSSAIVKVAGITQYFVGTSVGLYTTSTPNGTSTAWTQVGSSEINYAVISQMRYRPSDNKILAGTHGNGMFLINLADPFILAIKLQTFKAVKQGENALLSWTVDKSSTAKNFEVLKSTDGNIFESMKDVSAVKNSTSYQTVDVKLSAGVTYYKLKITDENGSISYSKIAAVNNGEFVFKLGNLSPNPVKSISLLNITAVKNVSAVLTVAASNGSIVLKQNVNFQKGNNNFSLDLSNLASGVYFIYATDQTGKSNLIQFVKE
ncbi:MAG: T9SS type A sorting domain-containing protein [Ferruginibacter sp.]